MIVCYLSRHQSAAKQLSAGDCPAFTITNKSFCYCTMMPLRSGPEIFGGERELFLFYNKLKNLNRLIALRVAWKNAEIIILMNINVHFGKFFPFFQFSLSFSVNIFFCNQMF